MPVTVSPTIRVGFFHDLIFFGGTNHFVEEVFYFHLLTCLFFCFLNKFFAC